MPNWAYGYVTVEGNSVEDVMDFVNYFLFDDDKRTEDGGLIKRPYFARSFVHEDLSCVDLKQDSEANGEGGKYYVGFSAQFAWSAHSCLIEGYPQRNPDDCITLVDACIKHNVDVHITTEEEGLCFEEEISCDGEGNLYDEDKPMPYFTCPKCGFVFQPADTDLSDYICWECEGQMED